MDDKVGEAVPDTIRVLHLDDDPGLVDVTGSFLEREGFEVISETTPEEAIERVGSEQVDCVVSDYEMPEMNGLEFLDDIREEHPDLPFILFTGKGSEEIASEAISRGVTDYLQKALGSDQYTVLANRIRNAVAQRRAEQEVERRSAWYEQILRHSSDYVLVVNNMGKVSYVSPAITRVMQYEPEEVIGTDAFDTVLPEDREYAANAFAETIGNPGDEVTVEFRAIDAEGDQRWLEARGANYLDDPIIEGVMVNVRDITERKLREQDLERQKDHLQGLTRFLTHDVQNQLTVLEGYVTLIDRKTDIDEVGSIQASVDRIDEMIEKVGTLAESGQAISDQEAVSLEAVVEDSRQTTITPESEATVEVLDDVTISADRERLQTLLENILGNAVEHGGPAVNIEVGALEHGFYVADDGPGIPEDQLDEVFSPGATVDGAGLGLVIVDRIAEAHGWEVTIETSDAGGARFEIDGVETAD